jgi:hypothetical protein
MKFCKIILIVFLIFKSIVKIAEVILKDDSTLEDLLACLLGLAIAWGLYWGAGVLYV